MSYLLNNCRGFPMVWLPGWLWGPSLCSYRCWHRVMPEMWLLAGVELAAVSCPTSALPAAAPPHLGTASSASERGLHLHPSRKSSAAATKCGSELPQMPGCEKSERVSSGLGELFKPFYLGLVVPCLPHIKNIKGLSCMRPTHANRQNPSKNAMVTGWSNTVCSAAGAVPTAALGNCCALLTKHGVMSLTLNICQKVCSGIMNIMTRIAKNRALTGNFFVFGFTVWDVIFRGAVHLWSPPHSITASFQIRPFVPPKIKFLNKIDDRVMEKIDLEVILARVLLWGLLCPMLHLRVHWREIGKDVSPLCRTWKLGSWAFQVVCAKERQENHQEEQVGYCEPQMTWFCPCWSEWHNLVLSVIRVRAGCEALAKPYPN